jgi:hypothetical protein
MEVRGAQCLMLSLTVVWFVSSYCFGHQTRRNIGDIEVIVDFFKSVVCAVFSDAALLMLRDGRHLRVTIQGAGTYTAGAIIFDTSRRPKKIFLRCPSDFKPG